MSLSTASETSTGYQCPKCLVPRRVVATHEGTWACMNGKGTQFECGYSAPNEEEVRRALVTYLREKDASESSHKHCCIACSLSEHETDGRVRKDYEAKIRALKRQVVLLKKENKDLREKVSTLSSVPAPAKRMSSSRRYSGRFDPDVEAEQDTIESRRGRRSLRNPIDISMRALSRSVSASSGEGKDETKDGDKTPDVFSTTQSVLDVAVFASRFCSNPVRFVNGICTNAELAGTLNGIGDWDFDIFAFEKMLLVQSRPMLVLGHSLLSRLGCFDRFGFDKEKTLNWLTRIESAYKSNPYHNNLHGADVMLVSSFWFDLDGFGEMFDDFDRIIVALAGAAHDVGHNGTNNAYHRISESKLAVLYNDQSVLENYHVSFAFQIMKKYPECDWLSDLDQEYRARARNLMVKVILGTDMDKHGKHVSALKEMASETERNHSVATQSLPELSEERRVDLLVSAFHLGDIGNACKKLDLCVEWAKRVVEEFRLQGDAERRHGWTPTKIFERSTPLERVQIGWIKFVVLPYIELFAQVCPGAQFMAENCRSNLEFWMSFKE